MEYWLNSQRACHQNISCLSQYYKVDRLMIVLLPYIPRKLIKIVTLKTQNSADWLMTLLGLTALIRRTLCMMVMAFPAAFAGRDELSNNPSNARNRFPKNRSTPSPPRDVILPSIALTQALTLIVSWCFSAVSHFLLHFCTPRKQVNGLFSLSEQQRDLSNGSYFKSSILSCFSINLLAFYHEYRSLIGFATHYLLNN